MRANAAQTGARTVRLMLPERSLVRLSAQLKEGRPEVTEENKAAVAMILRQAAPWGTGFELLVIRRAERAQDPWSGHMAMPGGRAEPGDSDLLDTAVREVAEEVGWQLQEAARYLGSLEPVPIRTRGRLLGDYVVPLVFLLEHEASWRFNDAEVVEALWLPLNSVLSGEADTVVEHTFDGVSVSAPAFRAKHHAIWGLTHHMITRLAALIRAAYSVEELERQR
ncbi:MAG: CoA pyrophosphatase [Myxococcales bacterium]|nr:CoA pyrophosphatase [Myxococcales bacterium]